jgi:DNA-binding MarR family transcriptional regulator/GNAT superfamily N-acetyltransferase
MTVNNMKEAEQISSVREFNRFYTARLGWLRKRHLDGKLSLTESRILYEIGANPGLTASSLRNTLGLNAGYVSRSLALLTKRKLVCQTVSERDGREKLLTLTSEGVRTVTWLNEQSTLQIRGLLANLNPSDRDTLIESLSKVRSILSEPKSSPVRIVRLSKPNNDALQLLREYYEAVNVVLRDTPEAIQKIICDPSGGMWIAYLEEEIVGCVILKRLGPIPLAGECKRLYVRPKARGRRIADKLLDALEDFARSNGLRWIYLDTYDDLKAAIALYRKRGYVPCERYNDNPQATVFLRKSLGTP